MRFLGWISIAVRDGSALSNPDLTIWNPFIRELFQVLASDGNELL
jgi:hypothetical protein